MHGSDTNPVSADGPTPFSPDRRDELADLQPRGQREAIEAALFGVSRDAPSVGRYRLLDRLGSGGMGTVYAAYDDRLDRKIAIKLIKTRRSGDEVRQRTLREARVLARLSHPNVVHVYEVGDLDGELFVAMEFMAGPTLRSWLDEPLERSWQEVLTVLRQAGEGLAAAHAIGIVHRDFKPHNAMFGADNRVRVLDFGLAGFAAGDELSASTPTQPDDSTTLTRTGTLMGTPAYMAPEQFAGKSADARSDQFGFCVAFYEALYGQRPFAGSTLSQLQDAVCNGKIAAPPAGSKVPAWLRKVVLRGLATDPAQRFVSMRALLAALADDPAVRRRNWILATVAAGLFAGGLWGVSAREPEAGACTDMDAKLAGVWDDARRQQVEAGILASGSSFAASTWPRVEALLDDYTEQWVAARTEACQATVRAEQSGELLDRRMACLDSRLVAVRATVEVLAKADASVVEDAVELVSGLPTLDRCADIEALQAEVPPPEDEQLARSVASIDDRRTEIWALTHAGKLQDALGPAQETLTAAERLDWDPLTARVLLLVGHLHSALGQQDESRSALERSYRLALEQHMMLEAGDAAVRMFEVRVKQGEYDEARRWTLHADALTLASKDRGAQADFWRVRGNLERNVGNDDEARVALERALQMLIEVRGPEHPEVGLVLNSLGVLARATEHLDEARDLFERALAIEEASLGPEHPRIATTLTNLGNIALLQAQYDEARALHLRALEVARAAFGTDHETTALALANLANLAHAEGKRDEARVYTQQVLEIRERVFGPKHPQVALALINVGARAMESGDEERARASLGRALAIQEEVLGPTHRELGLTLLNLSEIDVYTDHLDEAELGAERAHALFEQLDAQHPLLAEAERVLGQIAQRRSQHEQALERFEAALAILEASLGPEHPQLAGMLLEVGTERIDLGQAAEAIAPLERGMALLEQFGGFVGERAVIEDRLAEALYAAPVGRGRDRKRAIELGTTARGHYVEAGADVYATELTRLGGWLASKR